jgi:hypothetical protein
MEIVTIGILALVGLFAAVYFSGKIAEGTKVYKYRTDENGNEVVIDMQDNED